MKEFYLAEQEHALKWNDGSKGIVHLQNNPEFTKCVRLTVQFGQVECGCYFKEGIRVPLCSGVEEE